MLPVAVIIVTYNSRPDLGRALRSIQDVFEVVVVDNASEDGTAAFVRTQFPDVTLLALDENVGFGRAVNLGARQTHAPILFLMNPDAWLEASSLKDMVCELRGSGAWALGPRQIDSHGALQLAFGGEPTLLAEAIRCAAQRAMDRGGLRARVARALTDAVFRRSQAVPWVSGAGLMVWRSRFTQIGGFDPSYFLFFEDIDFCLRLRRAGGWVLYAPHLTLGHARGQSAGRAPTLARRAYRRSQAYFASVHMGFGARLVTQRWAAHKGQP